MLFDDLKKAKLMAMKNKDTAAKDILSVVVNKAMLLQIEKKTKNEELVDADVLNIIQKTIKELDDEITAFKNAGREEKTQDLANQQNCLKQFLPAQMTESEIISEIEKLEDKSIPSIMKYFKANFNGKCDMKLVNELAKSYK